MEQDTFLDWLFPALYRSSRYCFPSVCSPNGLKKKTHITQTIVCRLIVSVLQTNSVFSRFMLLSCSLNSKLSANPSWVKWCIFKTSQISHSLERAQEVEFFPQWSGEGQKSVMSISSDICNFCTCATGCQKIGNGCSQSPSFPDHVTKKRRALGTRMRKAHTCMVVVRMRSSSQCFFPAQSREWDRRHMHRPPKYSPGHPHSYERI